MNIKALCGEGMAHLVKTVEMWRHGRNVLELRRATMLLSRCNLKYYTMVSKTNNEQHFLYIINLYVQFLY